jgi:O-acetyl-ADP-ribose deacetylase (regulator of RNase III)
MFLEDSGEAKDYSLLHSIDDKAYIPPGTSEGFFSARNQRILTLSDATKAKKLPKYDWPEKYVYQTPGSHRVMTKESDARIRPAVKNILSKFNDISGHKHCTFERALPATEEIVFNRATYY